MKPIGQILTLSRPFWRVMLGGLLLSCLAAMANFALLFLSGWLLAAAAVAGAGGIAAQNLFNLFLPASGVRFFATVRILSRYAERLMTHDGALRLMSRLRGLVFARLIPRSSLLVVQNRSGDLLNRLVADTEKVGQLWTDALLPFATAVLSGLLSVLVAALFSPAVGLLLFGFLAVAVLAIPALSYRLMARPIRDAGEIEERMRGDLVEAFNMMEDTRFSSVENVFLQRLSLAQQRWNRSYLTRALRSALAEQGLALTVLLALLGVLLLAAQGLAEGRLSSAELPMLVLGCLAAFAPCLLLVGSARALVSATAAGQRLFALTEAPLPVAVPEQSGHPRPTEGLALRGLSLRYPLSRQAVLHDLSLSVRPGERVGIIGSSGAGKSSLIRVLTRLIEFQGGSAQLAGLELRQMDTQQLSGFVGVLMQETHLFQGSIRHNLDLACPGATEEAMWHALHLACLDEDVQAMAKGLDTRVGNLGVALSGGQARRLAMAQILLRRPDYLLLDEPTEGLSSAMGERVLQRLFTALPHATVICISHRQEPLQFMHRVLRMDNGRLVDGAPVT